MEQGKCPQCESYNLAYTTDKVMPDTNNYPEQSIYYYRSFKCNDCGHDDTEYYRLEFIGYDLPTGDEEIARN